MTGSSGRASTRSTCLIDAVPEALYTAFTDPAALAAWMAPGEMTARVLRFDGRVGGGYEMVLTYPASEVSDRGKTTGREDRYTARFMELVPPQRVVTAIAFETTDAAYSGEMAMEATFAAEEGKTRVTLIFRNLPPGVSPEDNERGTQQSLEKLARLVAKSL